jgi:hypothetical protein
MITAALATELTTEIGLAAGHAKYAEIRRGRDSDHGIPDFTHYAVQKKSLGEDLGADLDLANWP